LVLIPSDVSVGDPTEAALQANAWNQALTDLDSEISALDSTGIKNGNFEIDTASEPDNWTFTENSGASHSLNTSTELSGTQSITLTTDATSGAIVEMLSDKVKGGNLAINLSFQFRQTAARPKFTVNLKEFNTAGTLVSTLEIASLAGAASGLNTDVIGMNINGLTGIGTQYAVEFILGEAAVSQAGSVDIDYVLSETRPDIISRQEFEVTSGGGGFQEGWIYIDSAYTSVDVDVWMAGIVNDSCNVEINGTNGNTISVSGAVGERNDATGTSSVTLGAWTFPGIFTFKIETGGWQAKTTMGNANGIKDGLVFTP
jgi:hypothetical protein